MYSIRMRVRVHLLREKGWPIPKYQFAFLKPIEGDLTLHEEADRLLNRHTRVAKLRAFDGQPDPGIPPLLDAQLVELSRGRMVLSGIERHEDPTISRIEDYAQTWVCWLGEDD